MDSKDQTESVVVALLFDALSRVIPSPDSSRARFIGGWDMRGSKIGGLRPSERFCG